MSANVDEYIQSSAREYKELFEQHEKYFKEITDKANDNFKKLSEAISKASDEISACRNRNEEIRQ